ncbi:hypothetical protein HPB50_001728 [Hyalomma asiaticum]|uniref:Uncharacterized protein n=1 Tax=Hyalomma asiaticum TaxID=266040 RepID=A0ACB7SSJ4_HYAAI|nr:hypothetical protein HPB50_001728 [Hyalomma asiaticum]
MDLSKLRKPDLVMLCEEMGIEVAALRRKPLLIQALEDSGADEEELSECWELIQERMKRESEDKERETVRRKEEAEIQIREIERLRFQLQIVEAKCASSGGGDENMQLLRPYLRDLVVNGKDCKVLRDSGATMDIVHPDYVEATHLTGECAWIRQVAEKNSICLPIAKVTIEGPFGVLETEAAVSPNLPRQYPYLFSNKSYMLLKKRGLSFGEFIVQAITRSKARELAAERAGEGEQPRAVDPCEQASTSAGEDGSRYVAPVTLGDSSATDAPIPLSAKEPACDVVEPAFPRIVLPHSESSLDLLNVDEDTLMRKPPIDVTPTGTHNGHFREQRHCSPYGDLFGRRTGCYNRQGTHGGVPVLRGRRSAWARTLSCALLGALIALLSDAVCVQRRTRDRWRVPDKL